MNVAVKYDDNGGFKNPIDGEIGSSYMWSEGERERHSRET